MRRNKKKKIIIIALLGILTLMTAGYAALQTNLNIKGTSKINSNWDIRITNVREGAITGDAEKAKESTWNELTANIEANLYQKGDSIEYIITVENKGTIDAILNNISTNKTTNEAIKFTYSGINKNDKLYKGESTEIKVKIEYNPNFNGTPEIGSTEINITLDYIQAEVGGIEVTKPNLYVSNNGNDETGIGSRTKPYKTIKKAYEEAQEESTIYIMDDIIQNETLNFDESKNVTLTSYGTTNSIIRGNDLTESIIYQTSGSLTLNSIVIDGNNVQANSALIILNSENTTLNVNDNSVLKNNNNINDDDIKINWGGAINCYQGQLIINGGTISNNIASRGSIIVFDNITINSGTISNNTSRLWGGGISCVGNCIMNGGTIDNNQVIKYGGGGINIDGTFTLNGGTISNNHATQDGGGIRVGVGTATINGGTISNNHATQNGGGISIISVGSATIKNGNINNNSTKGKGSGIYVCGTLTIENGSIINNHTEDEGGGIYANGISNKNCTVTIKGGMISKNTAVQVGGVSIVHGATVTMTGGVISKNEATTNVGGVSLWNGSKFILDGGTIRNNKSQTVGGIRLHNEFISDTVAANTYTYKSGIVCENTPANSYETHTTCPA